MNEPKPSLHLLREMSDAHVLRAFIDTPRLTRAEVAAITGLSKPTVGQSVQRLTDAGLLTDTGERTTGRGAVGTYYAFVADAGAAMTVGIQPEGIVAELVDPFGTTTARTARPVARSAPTAEVTHLLVDAATEVSQASGAPVLLATVSAADPVDRATGRLVDLPDAAFLVGPVDPVAALQPLVEGPVIVDNDVNWAAMAERQAAADQPDDFAYLFLGEGLGCAVVADGEVRAGAHGLAGEISHLTTTGPDGRAMRLTRVFADLGLHHLGGAAINIGELRARTAGESQPARELRHTIAVAVTDVLAALVALTDPAFVIVGGPWGSEPDIFEAIEQQVATTRRPVPIRPPTIADNAPLAGARQQAVALLQERIVLQNLKAGDPTPD